MISPYMTPSEVSRETFKLNVRFTVLMVLIVFAAVMSCLTKIWWFMPLAALPVGGFVGHSFATVMYFRDRLKFLAKHGQEELYDAKR